MRTVFADTLYWTALAHPGDQWHTRALEAEAALAGARLVTTDEVLIELVNGLSRWGPSLRRCASSLVRELIADPNVEIVPQTHDGFLRGLALHEQRADKAYSLTDCISMTTMRDQG